MECEALRDFDKSKGDLVVQQADKVTGLPLWVIEVINAAGGPAAHGQGQGGRAVPAGAAAAPAGSPFIPVEFEGLQATPYVDASRCKAKETASAAPGSRTR